MLPCWLGPRTILNDCICGIVVCWLVCLNSLLIFSSCSALARLVCRCRICGSVFCFRVCRAAFVVLLLASAFLTFLLLLLLKLLELRNTLASPGWRMWQHVKRTRFFAAASFSAFSLSSSAIVKHEVTIAKRLSSKRILLYWKIVIDICRQ